MPRQFANWLAMTELEPVPAVGGGVPDAPYGSARNEATGDGQRNFFEKCSIKPSTFLRPNASNRVKSRSKAAWKDLIEVFPGGFCCFSVFYY